MTICWLKPRELGEDDGRQVPYRDRAALRHDWETKPQHSGIETEYYTEYQALIKRGKGEKLQRSLVRGCRASIFLDGAHLGVGYPVHKPRDAKPLHSINVTIHHTCHFTTCNDPSRGSRAVAATNNVIDAKLA